MKWKVDNALSRDVERQQLNKILADINTTVKDLRVGTSQKPVTNTVNTVTRYAVARFTLTLDGAIIGSGEIDGLNDVTITTAMGSAGFLTDAPIDSRTYARRNGEWRVLPLDSTVEGTGILVQILGPEEVPEKIVREIEIVTDELTVVDGDGQAGNPTLGLADTAATPGTYGDADNIPQITVDQKGRITNITEVAATGGSSTGGILPVVTGEVPPVFVYLDDGSLVYAEVA